MSSPPTPVKEVRGKAIPAPRTVHCNCKRNGASRLHPRWEPDCATSWISPTPASPAPATPQGYPHPANGRKLACHVGPRGVRLPRNNLRRSLPVPPHLGQARWTWGVDGVPLTAVRAGVFAEATGRCRQRTLRENDVCERRRSKGEGLHGQSAQHHSHATRNASSSHFGGGGRP